jgi:hypothetical protein
MCEFFTYEVVFERYAARIFTPALMALAVRQKKKAARATGVEFWMPACIPSCL